MRVFFSQGSPLRGLSGRVIPLATGMERMSVPRRLLSSTKPDEPKTIGPVAGLFFGGVVLGAGYYINEWLRSEGPRQIDAPIPPPADITSKAFLDIEIDRQYAGRIVFGLHGNVCPRTVENFERLCRGTEVVGDKKMTYRGSTFPRIIPNFIAQGGTYPGPSVYGSVFDDENFELKHSGPGVLSSANSGPNSNGSGFFITLNRATRLDGKHVAFGTVLEGWDVVKAMEECGSKSGYVTKVVNVREAGVLPK